MAARVPCWAILALLLAALAAPTAHAASDLEIGIADDALVLKEHDALRAARVVGEWRAAGVDAVRLFAEWHVVSPGDHDTVPPAGFDPANPDDRQYEWAYLDRAVRLVAGAGMRVILTITGPGPLWASAEPLAGDPRHKPRADLFGQFARAVAVRYGRAVDRYIIWNEPNIPLWLKPQFTCAGGRCTPYAPHLYRRLVQAAYGAIRSADPGARVLFGALAPRGNRPRSRNATMRPLTFLRALGCVGSRLERIRTGPCRGFLPLTADGFSYHPHGVLRAPDAPNPNADEASLGDLPRLQGLLDGIQRANGLRNAGSRTRPFDLYFTEYGYQTRPPDPKDGVQPALQARWLQQAAYLAWRNPRVRNLTQYEWRDEPVRQANRSASGYAGWQSGLHYADGRAKPATRGFVLPFWADQAPGSRTALLWGQVRPGAAHEVSVQRRTGPKGAWTRVRRVRTDARGFFTLRVTVIRAADYRVACRAPGARAWRTSDSRRVTPPPRRRR